MRLFANIWFLGRGAGLLAIPSLRMRGFSCKMDRSIDQNGLSGKSRSLFFLGGAGVVQIEEVWVLIIE